jgi:hypothetical protein
MIKIIYNDGCSLGAGAEHKSWEMLPEGEEICDSTWTDIIKTKYYPNAKKITKATTGSSNRGIRRRTIHNVLELLETYKSDEILVFIMWTSFYRREFLLSNPKLDRGNKYFTLLPSDTARGLKSPTGKLVNSDERRTILKDNHLDIIADEIYTHHNKPLNHLYESLADVEATNMFLKLHSIRSVQCFGFGSDVNPNLVLDLDDVYTNSIVKRVLKYNIYYIPTSPPQGFYEYSVGQHFELGPGLHPLESAHRAWANIIPRHFRLTPEK